MKQISWCVFIIYFLGAYSNLFALGRSGSQEEIEFENRIKEKTLKFQQSFEPMTFLPDFCSCWTAGGVGMGLLDVGTGALAIAPGSVICSKSVAGGACVVASIIPGIIGGGVFLGSLVGTGVLIGYRYIKVNKHNEPYYRHMALLNLIETAFNYDDNGPKIKTSNNSEVTLLIEDPNSDVLHQMINEYHLTYPTYVISAPELARRIREAVFAGYFAPLHANNAVNIGKWADMNIGDLMIHLAIKPEELTAYYDNAQENYAKLFQYEKELINAETNINSPVFNLSNTIKDE